MLTASWRLVLPCMRDAMSSPHTNTGAHTKRRVSTHTNSVSFTRKQWNCSKRGDLRMKRLVRGICQASLSGYLHTVVMATDRKGREGSGGTLVRWLTMPILYCMLP